jgi:hypothetical protein
MNIAASITACPMCREESYGLERYGPPHKARPVDDKTFEQVTAEVLSKPVEAAAE